MFGRRMYSGARWFRRLVAFVVLVSVCASFFPLPVGTIPPRSKDQSEPFPCQKRPCGCASADQCWKQCCCFTNAEKLVWARENGVIPPQFVVEAARAESSTEVVVKDEASNKMLCPHFTKSTTGEHSDSCRRSSSQSECCSTSEYDHQHHDEEQGQPEEDSIRFVIGIEMMKCRGQGIFWNSLPWAVIPIVHVPEFRVAPVSWDRPASVASDSIAAEPPEPPPKLA